MSPYNEGYRAYFNGYARIENPYEDALDYSEWDEGWVNAMFEDQEREDRELSQEYYEQLENEAENDCV